MIPDAPAPLHYRLPPVPVLLSAVVLIACAEVGGLRRGAPRLRSA